MTDIKNCVALDKGALKMALNVLDRAGKKEVAEALRESCVDLGQLIAKAEALELDKAETDCLKENHREYCFELDSNGEFYSSFGKSILRQKIKTLEKCIKAGETK